MAPDSLINRVGWCKVSGVSLLLDVRYCSCDNLNVLEIYKRGGGRYGAQLSKSKFSSLKKCDLVVWLIYQLTRNRRRCEMAANLKQTAGWGSAWPALPSGDGSGRLACCKAKVEQQIMPLKKIQGVDLDLQSFSFESEAFFPCFSEPSSTPSSSHISWHCLPDSGWRSLSKALRWGMEIVHIVQVPWLITDSDSSHSNNKKLDLFLQLGSATALGRKHFWNYIFIKIWENIWGGAQGDILNGTLRPIFS